jgi:hypothetical protein
MNHRGIDFAETYSKMSDEQLSQVISDEKSLLGNLCTSPQPASFLNKL